MFRYTTFLNVKFFRCLMWVVWHVKLFKHARSRQFDCESRWSNNLNHRHQWITNIGNWIDNLSTKLRESHYVFFVKFFTKFLKIEHFTKDFFFKRVSINDIYFWWLLFIIRPRHSIDFWYRRRSNSIFLIWWQEDFTVGQWKIFSSLTKFYNEQTR